jgi:glycosyltransferase involved in cell wall biosynthesis
MSPSVSVIVATYNYGRFLAGALESVLAQTFADFEVIVINDGSTDDTAEVMVPFLSDPRVRYYRTNHLGQPAAKNVGIRFARAPLVAFLDADDLWLPRKLEKQVARFRADPTLGVVYSRRLLIDEDGQELEYGQPALHRGGVLEEIFQTNFVCFSSAVVRRAVFDDVGSFDEDLALAIDYDLWLRVAMAYRFDYVDDVLVKYRTGHTNLSCRLEERLATVDRIMRRFLDRTGGRFLVNPAVVRRARAELCYQTGLVRRGRSRLAALPCYVRALTLSPGYGLAWQGLVSLPLPEKVRRWCRRALGKPVDWAMRRPIRVLDTDAEGQPGRRLEHASPTARAD